MIIVVMYGSMYSMWVMSECADRCGVTKATYLQRGCKLLTVFIPVIILTSQKSIDVKLLKNSHLMSRLGISSCHCSVHTVQVSVVWRGFLRISSRVVLCRTRVADCITSIRLPGHVVKEGAGSVYVGTMPKTTEQVKLIVRPNQTAESYHKIHACIHYFSIVS